MTIKQLSAGDNVTEAVRLVRPLAEGGMGRVWVAEHSGLQAQVVVKLMAPEIAARPDGAARFAREAAAAAAIKSPHVVQIFDHGVTANGEPYIVMELLEGKDLGAHLAENGRMAPADVVTLVCQLGKALSKAHRASIIHRDLKPENIFLCETDGGELFVKLLDFGTARRETGARQTTPGLIVGTPCYMSPEQSVGAPDLDERSDIWSLGVVAFEALTGKRPFDGPSVGAIAVAVHGPAPKVTGVAPHLPPAIDEWFERACAREPKDRFQTVREAVGSLVEAVTGAPPVSEQFTESIHFPIAASSPAAITSMAPISAPIRSLISTLPAPGSERRFTTIAAGAVMAVAAVAMAAIVLGRSPSPAPAAAQHAEVARAPEPGPAEATPPPPPPSEPAYEPEPTAPQPPVATAKPAEKPVVRAKASKPAQRAPTRSRPAAGETLDDDLVRLTNATSKQIEPTPAPAPTE